MKRVAQSLRLLIVLLVPGCHEGNLVYHCKQDAQCDTAPGGACITPPGGCAFPATDCASGLRFDASAEGVGDQCVPAQVDGSAQLDQGLADLAGSCNDSTDCVASGKTCKQGLCVPCAAHTECTSGYCVAGICGDPTNLVYVSKACTPPGTGRFTNPYCLVSDGLLKAAGQVVVVEAGTYSEDLVFQADANMDLVTTAVAAGTVTLMPKSGGVAALQVLNGVGNAHLTSLTLDGFTISGTTAVPGPPPPAAVICDGSINNGQPNDIHTTLNMSNISIVNNSGQGSNIKQCRFSSDRMILRNNSQGGMVLISAGFSLSNTAIYHNGTNTGMLQSIAGGITIVSAGPSGTLANVTIVENSAGMGVYGGIDCEAPGTTIINTAVLGNTGPAGDINAATCMPSYSAFVGASAGGTGTNNQDVTTCLAGDLFVAPGNGDYHPKTGGGVPCTLVDDGIDGFGGAMAPDHDFDGKPRPAPQGGKFDIGAYEAQ